MKTRRASSTVLGLACLALAGVPSLLVVPQLPGLLAGQTLTLPPVSTQTVTVNTNGVITSPTNVIAANGLATTSNVATAQSNAEAYASNAATAAQSNAETSAAATYLPLAGGTMSGPIVGGDMILDMTGGNVEDYTSTAALSAPAHGLYDDAGQEDLDFSDAPTLFVYGGIEQNANNWSIDQEGDIYGLGYLRVNSIDLSYAYTVITDINGSTGAANSTLLNNGSGEPVWTLISPSIMSGLGTGVATLLGQAANTASGAVTQSGGDARYVQSANTYYSALASNYTGATGTTLANTSLSLTLPPGRYLVTCELYASTASSTGGINGNWVTVNSGDAYAGNCMSGSLASGAFIYPGFGAGANISMTRLTGGSTTSNAVCSSSRGMLTVATTTTYYFQMSQRATLDASNPPILQAGSYLRAVKQ